MQNTKEFYKPEPESNKGWVKRSTIAIAVCFSCVLIYQLKFTKSGYLFIESAPPGASIEINDQLVPQQTPALVGPLRTGKYRIILKHDQYKIWSSEIKIPNRDTLWITPELIVRDDAVSSLGLQTVPAGVVAMLDSVSLSGTTPLQIHNLKPGMHSLHISRKGYVNLDTSIILLPGDENLKIELQQIRGNLSINSTPANAKIWLDGQLLSAKTPHIINNVGSGTYTIETAKNGFSKQRRQVRVRDGKTVAVNFNFSVQKPQAGFGKVLLTAAIVTENNRERATFPAIIIDGELQGQAPSTFTLPAGRHKISARLSGFPTQENTVKIIANQTVQHKFEFSKSNRQ